MNDRRHEKAPCPQASSPMAEHAMTLSAGLRYVDLSFECKRCGNSIIKSGAWVISVSVFRCAECKGELRLTYSDKVALFAKHAHLA